MKENTEISERVMQLIDSLGVSRNDFADKLGYERSQTVYDITNGKAKPSFDFIQKLLLSEYSECFNLKWLITGKGSADKPEVGKTKYAENIIKLNDNKNDKENDIKRNIQNTLSNQYSMVAENRSEYSVDLSAVTRKIKFAEGVRLTEFGAPFYPLPVSAGTVAELLTEEEKPTGYISIPGISVKAYFPVIGCSFEPLIRAGDIIGIDFIDKWEILDPDCIYYILTHDQRMIKRLMRHPEDKGKLICISPNYKEFPLDIAEISKVYKVVFYGRLV